MGFFDENLLLTGDTARGIYKSIADLPIIDYHCHLNEADIKNDKKFSDIGELWLSGDHYKWRAMRLSGIDESYITGDRSYEEKFLKYAKIMPKLFGNPLSLLEAFLIWLIWPLIFILPAFTYWVFNEILERIFRRYMSEEDLKREMEIEQEDKRESMMR